MKMHWITRSIFGMFVMLFLFIGLDILSAGGISVFAPSFMGAAGLVILLSMGFAETNFIFYE